MEFERLIIIGDSANRAYFVSNFGLQVDFGTRRLYQRGSCGPGAQFMPISFQKTTVLSPIKGGFTNYMKWVSNKATDDIQFLKCELQEIPANRLETYIIEHIF